MTRADFFQHFELLSRQPDAVPKLRQLVLELAVRGKLVEQDPTEKKISLPTPKLPEVKADNFDFKIPSNWNSTRIGEILAFEYGDNLPAPKRNEDGRFPVYGSNGIVGHHDEFVVKKPAIIIGRKGSSGALNLSDGPCWPTDVSYYVVPPEFMDLRFTFFLLKALRLEELGKGIKPGLNRNEAYQLPITLPPLAEQRRIVARVEELMALCDELEQRQQGAQLARERLSQSAYHHLTAPSRSSRRESAPTESKRGKSLSGLTSAATKTGDDDFQKRFAFILQNSSLDSSLLLHPSYLRPAILQLAVQGRLVPQNPKDEPATDLLAGIRQKKDRLITLGKIQNEKPVKDKNGESALFSIPETWRWTRLSELTELITKGSSPKWQGISYVSKDEGVLFVTSENVGNYELRKLNDLKYVDKRFNEIEPRSILKFGDILMNLVGASIGRTAVYNLQVEANINQAVALIRLMPGITDEFSAFLLRYLNSPAAIQHMLSSQVVNAQPNISLTDARDFPVPIPPLAEQKRIVARVEELMRLCDALETQLSQSRTIGAHLLDAALQRMRDEG